MAADVTPALMTLHLTQRSALGLVPSLTADSASLLGLGIVESARLGLLAEEVIAAVIADAFDHGDDIDISLSVERQPGRLAVIVRDRGAPSSFARGDYPPNVAALVSIGFADALLVESRGREGNLTEIHKSLAFSRLSDDADFVAEAEAEAGPVADDEVITARPMTPDDVNGVARLFFRTYGYSAYQASTVYEPERLAELVRSGQHLATVAVTEAGRIVAHVASEVDKPGATTGRIGLLAIDPGFRGRQLTIKLAIPHVQRLLEMGFIGQYTEAVAVHDRSQRVALATGAHECGVWLAAQQASLDFRGFESADEHRRSVLIMFGAFAQVPERTSYVPAGYVEIVRRIYEVCNLVRAVESPPVPRLEELPETSTFSLRLKHEARVAVLGVTSFGQDFDVALQAQIEQLRINRFDVLWLWLPLSDPLTAHFGGGLREMGLSFAGVYPEYEHGDMLCLQGFVDIDVVTDDILVVSDFGRELLDAVVEDYRRAATMIATRTRSRARMARVYEALE